MSQPAWQKRNDTIANKITIDPLAEIYNEGVWRVSKVSPLYNLQYTIVKLKQYASKIRQAVVSAVTAKASIKYTVLFQEEVNLKYSEDDASGLILNVSVSNQENSNKIKNVYSAILLSWGVSCTLDNAIHLPYMLERGEQRIGTTVKATLQKLFDCNIKQFLFTQQQLLHFGCNFVEYDSSRSTDPFILLYKTSNADNKDKLILRFNVEDIRIIWNGVKEEVNNGSELVTLTYQILQSQIFEMLSIDITVCHLCEVLLPQAEVKYNGIVKMKTPEIVNCVFTLLNDISDIQTE